ncbi:hypothetical protein O3P69_000175 [Scylla paramamosain]|uniref:Uncharacterized protein n=1 Tax=Scylla paramamosain TaxID=85552 RepID=A0AAW0UUY7_SCYPA
MVRVGLLLREGEGGAGAGGRDNVGGREICMGEDESEEGMTFVASSRRSDHWEAETRVRVSEVGGESSGLAK